MTDDASADDKIAVTFNGGIWPVEPAEEFPLAEPDLPRRTVPEPASPSPWRRVTGPPGWHGTGPIGVATGPAGTAAGSAGLAATSELRLGLDPALAGSPPDRPHGASPEHPHGASSEHPHGAPAPDYAHGPRWAGRAWLALAAAAILVLTVAAGFALSPRPTKGQAVPAATSVQDASVAGQPGPVGTPAGAGVASTADPMSAAADPTRQPSTLPAAPRPVTVAYEAESGANKVSGAAFVTNYQGASGGRIVKNLGDWKNPAGPGSLTFTNVTVSASGVYTLMFYYVHANGDPTRTVVITVAGADPIDVTVSGGSVCCGRRAVALSLAAGRNAISFGNPRGPAPAIDKIEIDEGTAG